MDDDIETAAALDTPSRLVPTFSPIIERPPSPSKPLPPPPANMTNEALQQLIKALSHLGQQPPSQPSFVPLTQQTRIRPPDTFDGSNPDNLRPFLLQCQLTFNLYPQQFSMEESKVFFAISHMKRMALEWFKHGIMIMEYNTTIAPTWHRNWQDFVTELCTNFGPANPTGTVEAELC